MTLVVVVELDVRWRCYAAGWCIASVDKKDRWLGETGQDYIWSQTWCSLAQYHVSRMFHVVGENLAQHHHRHGDEPCWGVARGIKIMGWTIPGSLTIQVELANLHIAECAPGVRRTFSSAEVGLKRNRSEKAVSPTRKLQAAIAD